jgi:hypothetical protein
MFAYVDGRSVSAASLGLARESRRRNARQRVGDARGPRCADLAILSPLVALAAVEGLRHSSEGQVAHRVVRALDRAATKPVPGPADRARHDRRALFVRRARDPLDLRHGARLALRLADVAMFTTPPKKSVQYTFFESTTIRFTLVGPGTSTVSPLPSVLTFMTEVGDAVEPDVPKYT